MPRKSAASLAVVPAAPIPREPPPACLTPEEAAEWRRVVESLPAHWFPGASFTLLEIYCQVVTNARWLAVQMAAHERGSPEWRQWHALYVMEAKLTVQLATRLRLHPRWERTTVRKVPSGPRPWDKPPVA
jgi:phage terminase small subunit